MIKRSPIKLLLKSEKSENISHLGAVERSKVKNTFPSFHCLFASGYGHFILLSSSPFCRSLVCAFIWLFCCCWLTNKQQPQLYVSTICSLNWQAGRQGVSSLSFAHHFITAIITIDVNILSHHRASCFANSGCNTLV